MKAKKSEKEGMKEGGKEGRKRKERGREENKEGRRLKSLLKYNKGRKFLSFPSLKSQVQDHCFTE